MRLLLIWIGRLAGLAGVLMTLGAVLARLSGSYQLGSFDASTVLIAGVAGMVAACLAYLMALAEGRRPL